MVDSRGCLQGGRFNIVSRKIFIVFQLILDAFPPTGSSRERTMVALGGDVRITSMPTRWVVHACIDTTNRYAKWTFEMKGLPSQRPSPLAVEGAIPTGLDEAHEVSGIERPRRNRNGFDAWSFTCVPCAS
jgi:hypothetical protein